MGVRNFLIEGVSGTGKTSVCHELRHRGFHAVNGDTDLAYQGDPTTGVPVVGAPTHRFHIWRVDEVRRLASDQHQPVSFFCGGSRNHAQFLELFDAVFVLHVDADTLARRLDRRPPGEFGGAPSERALILRLHRTQEDVPSDAIVIDATAPLAAVVDDIVRRATEIDHGVT